MLLEFLKQIIVYVYYINKTKYKNIYIYIYSVVHIFFVKKNLYARDSYKKNTSKKEAHDI